MASIFVVYASQGEYSDRKVWLVAAYADRDEAEKHAWLATQWVHTVQGRLAAYLDENDDSWAGPAYASPYDPQMVLGNRRGGDYVVLAVPLLSAAPAKVEGFTPVYNQEADKLFYWNDD